MFNNDDLLLTSQYFDLIELLSKDNNLSFDDSLKFFISSGVHSAMTLDNDTGYAWMPVRYIYEDLKEEYANSGKEK